MNLTHPNNRLTARHRGRSMIPFTDRGAHMPHARPAHRSPAPRITRALRLGHLHLKVRDMDRSLPFYTDMLDLRLAERTGRFAFLAIGNEHHSLALEEIGSWAVNPSRRAVGVAHFAFEVQDQATFSAMRRKVLDAGVSLISRNHGTSWAFRFKDPDGHEIEIYVDRRYAPGGGRFWKGRWHHPFDDASEPLPFLAAAA